MQIHPAPLLRRLVLLLLVASVCTFQSQAAKLLLIAGKQSHGPGDHEFRAGCVLLKKCLEGIPDLTVEIHANGWPVSESTFEGVSAILIYADGGGGHPAIQQSRLKLIDSLAAKGVGIGCAHYGVEVPKGDPGAALHRWIGGHYEHMHSVNPMWTPKFDTFPTHPVTRGVKPFALLDEWYFNMRWREDMKGITPILVATPSEAVRNGPYVYPQGPYKHIQEAKGRPETMMWTYERPDGGRGFGFTGGHKHVNWADDNFRKVVLNALLWITKIEVPANGVSSTVNVAELADHLDPKEPNASPVNLTGKWKFKVEVQSNTAEPQFDLIHAGNNMIGSYRGRFGEAPVVGSTRGRTFKINLRVPIEGEEREIVYSGSLQQDNQLVGTVKLGDIEGTFTATR